jgi:competence protein ComEA
VRIVVYELTSVKPITERILIGPTIAQRIVEYRQTNGSFGTIEDIQNVPGIGPITFEELKDLITVGP